MTGNKKSVSQDHASPHLKISVRNWKKRLVVSTILLIISLAGVIITASLERNTSFSRWYWTGAVIVFAGLSIWISRVDIPGRRIRGVTVWHSFLHWFALLVIILHIHLLVYAGIADNITAGLMILLLLALTTFLAGIYYDSTFCWLGTVLFVLAVVSTLLYRYLLPVAIIAIIAVALIAYLLYRKKSR